MTDRRPARPEELTACAKCRSENTEDSGIPNVHLQGNKRSCRECGTVAAGMPKAAYFAEVKEKARVERAEILRRSGAGGR